ncbi:MAG: hypothetical protein RIR62_639 [Pseudomonadota bacterium]|jgi:hypothetical protein
MGIELIAAFVAAVACAGLAMTARKLSGGRLPKWITPAAAGAGMIAFAVWNEYDWFGRLETSLPEGAVIIYRDDSPSPLRPWTMLFPMTKAFTAMDTRRLAPHPQNPDLVLAPVYAFARWQGVREGYMVVDCAARQSALLTEGVSIDASGALVGAAWTPAEADDPIGRAACSRG